LDALTGTVYEIEPYERGKTKKTTTWYIFLTKQQKKDEQREE
jgi:hypothetical protein